MWIRDDKKIKQLNGQLEEVTKPVGPNLQREKKCVLKLLGSIMRIPNK